MKTIYTTLIIFWVTLSFAQTTNTYQYFSEGWLKQFSNGTVTEIYTYDAVGNRKTFNRVITQTLADLTVTNLNVANTTMLQGVTQTVTCTVNNIGTTNSVASNLIVYLSANNTGTDTVVGEIVIPIITAGSSVNLSFDITIPTDATIGNLFLVFFADPNYNLPEALEDNNQANIAVVIEDAGPASAPTNFAYTINADDSLTLNWTALNDGEDYEYIVYYEGDAPVTLSSTTHSAGINVSTTTLYGLDQEPFYKFMVLAKDTNNILGEQSVVLDIDLAKYQIHTLNSGWNLIGFHVEPFDLSIQSVFAPIFGNIEEIKTELTFYNAIFPQDANTLNNIQNAKGYWIKLSNASQFTVRGKTINLNTISISLNQGWNLVSYPSATPENLSVALNSVFSNVIEVKHIFDFYNVIFPSGANTLTELNGERGYWVKVSQNCVLTY